MSTLHNRQRIKWLYLCSIAFWPTSNGSAPLTTSFNFFPFLIATSYRHQLLLVFFRTINDANLSCPLVPIDNQGRQHLKHTKVVCSQLCHHNHNCSAFAICLEIAHLYSKRTRKLQLCTQYNLPAYLPFKVLDKSWPIGTYTEIKRDTRGRVVPEGEWFISHTYRDL